MLLLPFAVEVRFTQPGISMLEWFYLFDDELASLHTPCSGERGPRADGAEPRARRLVHVRLRQREAQPDYVQKVVRQVLILLLLLPLQTE